MKNVSTLLLLPILLLLPAVCPTRLDAQALDTVWQVDYQLRMDSWDGKQYPLDTITVWFNEHLARQVVSQDNYVIIRGDSIHVVDTFHTHVSTVEIAWLKQIWMKDPGLVWRRRRNGPIGVFRDEERITIASYPTRKYHFDFFTNKEFPFPMRIHVWGTDELPMTEAELRNFYTIRTLIDNALAVDHSDINDTLMSWGVIPFRTRIVSNTGRGVDTSGIPVMELLSVKRTTMPQEHFLPPPGWTRESVPSPTEEQLWDLSGIPLPGGRKD